jgi:methyl-accepting chemotaxis protein
VDHLNWANEVNALLTDDTVSELRDQTDPHKSSFGQWYYGEGRKQAEALVPRCPAARGNRKPHTALYGRPIKSWRPTGSRTPGWRHLSQHLNDHMQWVSKLNESWRRKWADWRQSGSHQVQHRSALP